MGHAKEEEEGGAFSDASEAAWSATVFFGLGLVGVTLAVSSIHLLAVGALRGPVVVLPVIGVVCLAAGLLARRGTRRVIVAALLVASLVLLGNLGHLVDTLGLPSSPWDFVPNLAAAVGICLAIVAAVAHLLRREATAAGQRRVRAVGLGLVAAGAIASLALAAATPTGLPPEAVIVDTIGNEFSPMSVSVVAGDVVGVRNLDPYGHTFTVEALGIDLGIAGDATASVETDSATPAGSYQVICVLHPGIMTGTLTVTAGSG